MRMIKQFQLLSRKDMKRKKLFASFQNMCYLMRHDKRDDGDLSLFNF